MAKLSDSMSECLSEQEKLCDRVRRELESSEDPGKLVLDTVGDFFCENAELRKRSSVLLLEQLVNLRPRISAAVKAEAASLARRWAVEIGEKGRNGVPEVIGFLLLVSAYDLVDEFDCGGIPSVLRNLGNPAGPVGIEESCLLANDLANNNVGSQTLKEELDLIHMIATANNSNYDALECLCIDMNGKNLKLFLYEYLGLHDWSTELHGALKKAPDPAKLVMDTMVGFLSPQLESHKSLSKERIRTSSILLLEQLMAISPKINPSLKEEAFKLASHRGSNFAQMYQSPVIAYGFLLFVASYKIKSKYKEHELYGLLVVASRYKAHPRLCKALGFARKVEALVQILIRKKVLLGAVDYVCAHDLLGKFPPVNLLKDHLKLLEQRTDEQREKQNSQQAADEEIAGIRTVIEYVVKYKLESEYPLEELEKQILELEKKKNLEVHQITNMSIPPVSLASTKIDAQVKVEPSPKEDPKLDKQARVKGEPSPKEDPNLDNQAPFKVQPSPKEDPKLDNHAPVEVERTFQEKDPKLENQSDVKVESPPKNYSKLESQASKVESSTSLWPHFESLCTSVFGTGLSLLSRKDEKEVDFPASPSTSLWPELKSFCANMDGKSLAMFLYDHMDDHDLQYSVHDALRYAVDPAKLVLDAMPRNLHSNLEFDKSLSLDKVRNSRILLLEQLITIPPQISPSVKDKAQKMANEWTKMDAAPSNVYGFLLFIASYGLVSNYEVDEILKLLLSANYHKATPSLCRILGLQSKVSVIIRNLIQKNLILEAVEHIYEFELLDVFRPVDLLKYHMYAMRGIFCGSEDDFDREIAATRRFTVCIKKYKLESQYPLGELEKYKNELKIRRRVYANDKTAKFISP